MLYENKEQILDAMKRGVVFIRTEPEFGKSYVQRKGGRFDEGANMNSSSVLRSIKMK